MSYRILPKELQLIAENELNEVPNRVNDDIAALKTWINAQAHLHACTDDRWLLAFLRVSKFSLEKAKERIDRYYSIRSFVPELYVCRDPFLPAIQAVFDDCIAALLPVVSGAPIRLIFRIGTADPNVVRIEERIRASHMIIDALFQEYDELPIAGLCMLWDGRGITYKHVAQVTIPLLEKIAICVSEVFPLRLRALHIIYMPSIAAAMANFIMPLLSKKISSAVHFYADDGGTEIQKDFPQNLLPPEYGGQGPPLKKLSEELKVKVESHKDWYINDGKYFCDETKRSKHTSIANEYLGLDGSFRTLEFD